MKATQSQQAVINSKVAMAIITGEAKKAIAAKFGAGVELVEMAITAKNENVLSMMRKLVTEGIDQAANLAA